MVCTNILLYNKFGGYMIQLEIMRLDNFGRGIGYYKEKVVFVDNALPHEVVEIEIVKEAKRYYEAKVINYIRKNEDRVQPFCPFYTICGGCKLQHVSYLNSILYKEEKIKNIFKQAKLFLPAIQKIENETPNYYRNKLSLRFVNGKLGFYEEKSHHLVEITTCLIAKESINVFLKQAKKLHVQNGLLTVRANYNDELLLVIETEEKIIFHEEDFIDCKIVGVVVNDKTIYGKNFFYERMHGFLFKVSYNAFFQINPYITNKLFTIIEKNIEKNEIVLDLYSGVGTLGLVASKKANTVYSIEIVKNAVLDNLENKKLNQQENIFSFLGSADVVLRKIHVEFDTIIVDPPRKGLDKISRKIILESNTKKIIYISCDPMTLARDIKELEKSYKISKYYLLDMFSYTYHVESVCVLVRR